MYIERLPINTSFGNKDIIQLTFNVLDIKKGIEEKSRAGGDKKSLLSIVDKSDIKKAITFK